MPINTTPPSEVTGALLGFLTAAALAVPFLFNIYVTEKRHRKNMQDLYRRRQDAHETFLQEIDRLREQETRIRLEESLRRQISVTPTISVPITNCERRERRRRFLPLREDTDATS